MSIANVVDAFKVGSTDLARRPAAWILACTTLTAIVLFGYLVRYSALPGADAPSSGQQAILDTLMPGSVVTIAVAQLTAFGAPAALVLAVLSAGSGDRSNTVGGSAGLRSNPSELLIGRVLTIAAACLALAAAAFAVGSTAGAMIATAESRSWAGPTPVELLQGLVAGWLILLAHAALGLALALACRRTGLAVGLGLAYVLLVEDLLVTLPLGSLASHIGLGANALALSRAFGQPPGGWTTAVGSASGQAVGVLVGYVIALNGTALIIVQRRRPQGSHGAAHRARDDVTRQGDR